MAGATARTPMGHRILTCHSHEIELFQDPAMSLSDTVFGFLEQEWEDHPPDSFEADHVYGEDECQDEERENSVMNTEDKNNFWETQHQLLQATLRRTSSLETRIRNVTKKAVKESEMRNMCSCRRPVTGGCRNCMMREICDRLQSEGFNSAICKSKWRSSPDIPSGEHTFVDVLDDSNPSKREARVIVELNFRGEFEMARASEEYNGLVYKLPEVFIGKVDRLLALIKILCTAAKKCMKEKKMHMGPWRKNGYMEAKWLRVSERSVSSRPLSAGLSSRPPRPRASMLTIVLSENLPKLHCTAVKVL
ncbi:hypothetical protein LguiA_025203 [Lonicera macranthoides]